MDGFECEWSIADFSATASGTGDGRKVRVVGTGRCRTGGVTARLILGNAGTNPDPRELVLRLVEDVSSARPEVLTPIRVEGSFPISPEVVKVAIDDLGVVEVMEDYLNPAST